MPEPKVEKISYIPSSRKRFDVSFDEISRQRIAWYARAIREFRAVFPIPSVATLFGSIIKGKVLDDQTAIHSDVDLRIFFDADAFYTETDKLVDFMRDLGLDVGDIFRRHPTLFFRRVYLLKHVFRLCLERTRPEVESFLDVKKIDEGLFFGVIAHSGPNSILSRVKGYEEAEKAWCPETEEGWLFETEGYFDLGQIFSLNIGGGMKVYIRSFLRQCQQLPLATAERHWRTVLRCSQKLDRPNGLPDELKPFYPQTFKEALDFYRVERS